MRMVNKSFKSIWTIFLFLLFSLVSISLSSGEEEGNVGTGLVPVRIDVPKVDSNYSANTLQSEIQQSATTIVSTGKILNPPKPIFTPQSSIILDGQKLKQNRQI